MNIYIENLVKEYEKRVLDVKSLHIKNGEIVAVLGLNGSGKTTLLECIANIKKPSSGEIYYDNEPDFEKVKDKISIMQQKPYIFNMSARDNITLGLKYKGLKDKDIEKKLKEYCSYFNIVFLHKNAKKLSGGEASKVALLRIAVLERDLLLLDEPTASMDIESTLNAERLIKDINKNGSTVVMITHDLFQAQRIADTIIFMDKGKIIEINPKHKFFRGPENELIRKIILKGDKND